MMPEKDARAADTVEPVPSMVWWLVFVLAVVGVAAVFWAIPHAQDDLTAKSEQAVAAAGYTAVSVEFAGRDAVVSGSVQTAADLATVEEVVARIEGVRKVDVAGVTVVSETDGGEA